MKYRIVNPKSNIDKVQVEYLCKACRTKLKNPITEAGTNDSCPECGATFAVPGESDLKWYQNKEIVDKVNETEKSSNPVPEIKEKGPKRKIYGEDRIVVLGPAFLVQGILDSFKGVICGLVNQCIIKRVETCAHGMLLLGLIFVGILGPLVAKQEESILLWGVSAAFIVGIAISQFIAWKSLDANRIIIKNSPCHLQHTYVLDVFGAVFSCVAIGLIIGGISSAFQNNKASEAIVIIIALPILATAAFLFNPDCASIAKGDTDAGEEAIGLYAYFLKLFVLVSPFVYFSAVLMACIYAGMYLYQFFEGNPFDDSKQQWITISCLLIGGALYPFVAYIWMLSNYLIVSLIKNFFEFVKYTIK